MAVADAIVQSPSLSLTHLDLRGNRAGNVGADALAKAMKALGHRGLRGTGSGSPTGLRTLNLAANFLRSEVCVCVRIRVCSVCECVCE